MVVYVKKLNKEAKLPTFGSEYSAGADLYALNHAFIYPGHTEMIYTGIQMEIPKGYMGLIFARSGIAFKKGLAPVNKVGVIDCDYRGEIFVPLHNHGLFKEEIKKGDRVAQIIVVPYPKISFVEVKKLSVTKRGEGGIGSTGE